MTTFKTALAIPRAHPDLLFVLSWILATFAGGIAYVIPVGLVHLLSGISITEDFVVAPYPTFLAAALCGAACGSAIGLAQWLVLRSRLRDSWTWVLATIGGYASIGFLPLLFSSQPRWVDWANLLIVDGKMHWLARVEPEWAPSAWLPGAITLVLFGVVLGAVQWLVLRGRVRQAGRWIGINAIGWALGVLACLMPDRFFVLIGTWFLPLFAGAIGMVWLMRRPVRAGGR